MNKNLKDHLVEIGWEPFSATDIGEAYEKGDMEALFDSLGTLDFGDEMAEALRRQMDAKSLFTT